MPRNARRKRRDSITGTKAVGEGPDGPRNSGGEGLRRVFLRHVDSPDAKTRLERAFRMILRAAARDEATSQTQINDR